LELAKSAASIDLQATHQSILQEPENNQSFVDKKQQEELMQTW